jgi:hypothetical protein
MKKIVLLSLSIILLLSACKKTCNSCNANQDCNNGVCQCKQWFEGANCAIAMSDKFGGTFIGSLYNNGINPVIDTFIFQSYSNLGNSAVLVNAQYNIPARTSSIIFLENSTTATYKQVYSPTPQGFSYNITCGTASIAPNGQNLTLSFSPISRQTGIVDSSTLYTFIGVKQ